jgi:hypothetical protein
VLIGRTQAARVQELMNQGRAPSGAPQPEQVAQANIPQEQAAQAQPAINQVAPEQQPGRNEVAAAPVPPAARLSDLANGQGVDLVNRLRDSGEHKVADILQRSQERRQAMNDVQTELASMQGANPDLPHHGSQVFNDRYQLHRLEGSRPAEASAYAALLHSVHAIAPQIGLPAKAIKALDEKLKEISIDDAPGFVERFTKGLIKRGLVEPTDKADQIASTLEDARDAAMHSALNALYQAPPKEQQAIASASNGPPRIMTQEARDALPIGTQYMAPNGQIYMRA